MNNLTKKIVVGFLALSMALTATAGAFAQEDTSDDVAEIEALAESLGIDASVLLEGLGVESQEEEGEEEETASIAGIPEGFTFNNNMAQGAEGEAVKYLQILLNTDADTQVAETGAGSPGNETMYYGPATANAVARMQEKYAGEVLTPVGLSQGTGYFGASTRAKANALLGQGGGEEAPATNMSAILEQLTQLAAALQSLQERVDEMDPAVSEDAGEGYFEVEDRADIRDVELSTEETDDVASFRIKALESPITIQRMDVAFDDDSDFDQDGSFDAVDFRKYVSHMALKVDGEVIAEKDINRSTLDRDDEEVRFLGLNLTIEEEEYQDVVIELTATDEETTETIYVGFDKDGIRGLDGAGINKYNDDTPAAGIARSYDHVGEETGELEVDEASGNPEEGIVMGDQEDYTEVDLLQFDMTANDSDVDLEELVVDLTDDDTMVSDLILYHEGEELDVVSASAGTNTFEFDLMLNKDEETTFTVVADVREFDVDEQGFVVSADLLESDNTNVGYDMTDNLISVDGNARGEDQTMYVVLPTVSLESSDIEVNGDAGSETVAASMEVDVEATGGDIYLREDLTFSFVDAITGTWNVISDTSESTEDYVFADGTADAQMYELAGEVDLTDDNTDIDMVEGEYYEVASVSGTQASGAGVGDVLEGTAADETSTDIVAGDITGYVVDTVYEIADGDSMSITFNANVNSYDADGWERFEVESIDFHSVDEDDAYYHYNITNSLDMIDDLETDREYADTTA